MTKHFGQVKDLVKKGMSSDSFAEHFAQQDLVVKHRFHVTPRIRDGILVLWNL